MPSCIAPCDINYCNAVASNPRLFLLLGNARYDGMHEVRALVNNAYACKHRNALYRIMAVSGTFCMRGDNAHTSVHACMHTTHTRTRVCKCTPKSSRTSWIFHCLVEIPYPQPNIEIRKPSIELKFTLISVTICSLIFFICTFCRRLGQVVHIDVSKTCGAQNRDQYFCLIL